jgi:hypothetical protein
MVRNYRRKTEESWSTEDLSNALMNIKEGVLTINEAVKEYRISRATLYRQFKKLNQVDGKKDEFLNHSKSILSKVSSKKKLNLCGLLISVVLVGGKYYGDNNFGFTRTRF